MALETNNPIWNKAWCPCLKGEGGYMQCKEPVVKDYLFKLCNTINYTACFHFCKNNNLLKKPFEWIQCEAVEKSKVSINDSEITDQ